MECFAFKLLLAHLIFMTPIISSQDLGFRVNLRRRHDQTSLAKRLQNSAERSKLRSQDINQASESLDRNGDTEIPVRHGDFEFLMEVGVGTPAVNFEAIVDTGSNLIWTQCKPCDVCFNQSTPIFDPSKSSTYSKVPCGNFLCTELRNATTPCNQECDYRYSYTDGSFTKGVLSYETLSLGNGSTVHNTAFGCAHDTRGPGFEGGGIVGLGRGNLSLISQLGDSVNNKFSYCFLPITEPHSKTSPMIFGADLNGKGIKTMRVLRNSRRPSFWYVPITGITVAGYGLNIPKGTFDIDSHGDGGMFIDSGTTITYLIGDAYNPMKDAIVSGIHLTPVNGSAVGLDLCYKKPLGNVSLPSLTFNFEGSVDLDLPVGNYFIDVEDLLCLAIVEMGDNREGSKPMSILGNIQQQNFHFLYDNAKNQISFQAAKCDSL